MNLDSSQKAALAKACGPDPLVIVTGRAGTGKTTLITSIARGLGSVELLAPTGKAAARLREVTGIDARTVHSWLRWDGSKCNRTAKATLPLVIDEASMLDSQLLANVLKLQPRKLILVGDGAQVPPVGAGQPFHDALMLRPQVVATLDTCHRAQAAVHAAANLVRQGEMPTRAMTSGGETWRMVETGGPIGTMRQLMSWVRAGHYDPDKDIILTCRNETATGQIELNKRVVEIVNPRMGGEKWLVHDRIMNTVNSNERDWYNGDTGTVTAIDTEGKLWVELDRDRAKGQIDLNRDERRACQLAYALTVHKSQGSQYRRVFFVCQVSDLNCSLLNRNLIYTAITRAREGVVVLGQLVAFETALGLTAHKRTMLQVMSEQAA